MTQAQPAAAWFDDPSNAGQWRWWDGSAWTDQTSPKAGVAVAPALAAAPVVTPEATLGEPRLDPVDIARQQQAASGANPLGAMGSVLGGLDDAIEPSYGYGSGRRFGRRTGWNLYGNGFGQNGFRIGPVGLLILVLGMIPATRGLSAKLGQGYRIFSMISFVVVVAVVTFLVATGRGSNGPTGTLPAHPVTPVTTPAGVTPATTQP